MKHKSRDERISRNEFPFCIIEENCLFDRSSRVRISRGLLCGSFEIALYIHNAG